MSLLAAVVHRHLAALAQVVDIAIALGHELLQGEVPVHQHAWRGEEGGVSANPVGCTPVQLPSPSP